MVIQDYKFQLFRTQSENAKKLLSFKSNSNPGKCCHPFAEEIVEKKKEVLYFENEKELSVQ